MKGGHYYDRFRTEVQPALTSKVEEFKLLGYETITEEALWGFLTAKKWKKTKDGMQIYEVVSDILSVKVGEYMSFATVEAFKMEDFSFDNELERNELLK